MENKSLSKVKQQIEQSQIDAVKKLTAATLEHIAEKESVRNVLQEEIRILKHDVVDLKEGRLDRIVERHEVCDQAKSASAFTIRKDEASKTTNQWYIPYITTFNGSEQVINNSVAKMHTGGSYKLSDGTIKYI